MKYIRVSVYVLAISLMTAACTSIEEPTLKGVKDVEVLNINKERLEVELSLVLNNPNPFSLDLSSAYIEGIVDEKVLATINQSFDSSMPADAEFELPVVIDLNLKKLYENDPINALLKGMTILNEKKIYVQFVGDIKVGKGATKIAAPIDKLIEVKF